MRKRSMGFWAVNLAMALLGVLTGLAVTQGAHLAVALGILVTAGTLAMAVMVLEADLGRAMHQLRATRTEAVTPMQQRRLELAQLEQRIAAARADMLAAKAEETAPTVAEEIHRNG